MKKLLTLLLFVNILNADIVVFGDQYEVEESENFSIIYTKEHTKEAKKAKETEKKILKIYENSYGFKLDDTLYISLASSNNQIANAFATQFPLNSQVNYIGGAYLVDYMSTTSWLKTLLFHESAHNFQQNAKKNPLSKFTHKIVKNTPVVFLGFFPIFPIPNIFESSFMLEGNAVFNESRFNNGGRLYNGAHLAMAITQAKANLITPKRTYNSHLYFPYNTHHYIIGGFFQLFLAQKHGVSKVNEYFYNFSGQYIPMQTSTIFEKTFGNDYEKELSEYASWLQKEYKGFQPSMGEIIATSKSYAKLNSNKDEIFFLTSDALSAPTLQVFSKFKNSLKGKKDNFLFGEVFKVKDEYYTSSSRHTKVNKIQMGLFNSKAKVLKKTHSKIIQGVLKDGSFVYFDVNLSFDKNALFVRDEFYDYVNSSVFCDEFDNIYYFKQKDKTRTLYKNKKALLSLKGWYGFVVDVNENGVAFITSSKNGSSLYLYDGNITRLSQADDIVDAKFIDTNNLLITAITANGYNYIKTPIVKTNKQPYERTLFFEQRDDFKFSSFDLNESLNSKSYNSFANLTFSSFDPKILASEDEIGLSILASFKDPLSQNSANISLYHMDDESVVGVGYKNSSSRVRFGANIYAIETNDKNISSRGLGASFGASYPIYKEGYTTIDTDANYFISYDRAKRKPLSISLNYKNSKQFGKSLYPNSLNSFSIFAVDERGDKTLGLRYNFFYNLGYEFYTNLGVKYTKSDATKIEQDRGIEINNNIFSIDNDPSHFTMPSLKHDIFAKKAFKTTASIYKVLNLDFYSFKFPISLRRESIYVKYNYYDITFLNEKNRKFNEYILGFNLDLLLLHNAPFPISFEYIQNSDLKETNKFRVMFETDY